jgi:hypothetical protein
VLLEPSGNESSKFCSISVNKTANTEVAERGTLCEYYENYRFFTTVPSVTHIWITVSDFLKTHFTYKKDIKLAFKKMPEVIIELDKMPKDFYYLMTFYLVLK